ncbi:hypothetical protein PR002_g169 [Phytophthora rubi]|uniref:Ion transport domain-containing protein n=2 Tax=Phytophthora rubi TaxID=129364 RepID=A0A6A3P134_9STRA|nr:hypothetical protein PR002_g169 [Phytophthora rubi]
MSGVPRQTLPSSGTAASMALNAFRLSVERSRVRELASDPRSVNSSSTSRRLSRGASLGRNISINAKVAAATSPRDSMSESAAVAALKGRHEGPPSARASSAAGVFSSRFSAMPAPFGVTEFMQSIINASPGCYADDDGSSDILERYNFFAHGKRFLFAPCSLGIFDEANKFRQFVVWIVTSKSFDQVVLLLIATNSVMLAIVDVCHVDADGNPASEGSLRNTMADYSNSTFTALFAFECLLKIVAMGLIGDRGAYLTDPWNWIDFTVVVVGLIAALPSIPATAALILLNTVLLSLDQYPVDEELASIVDVINFVLTQIFLLEALVKVFGLGFQRWAEDRYNLFDALVVVLGIVEAIVSPPQFLSGSVHAKSQSFAGLRSMRIFRLFKLASTACVALDNPLSAPDSTFVVVVGYVDSVFAAIFVLEVVIKIIARGLCLHPTAYLRNGWNVMDFVITAVAIPGLQFFTSDNNSQQLKFISSLRIFRALRPLRMIHRNPGLKLVVSSLVSAIPQMLNVGMVCLLLLLIFSIIAVNNLKGRLFACSGDVFDALTTAQQALITNPRAWENLLADEKLWFNETTAALYASASVLATASEDIHGVDGITSRMICGYLNASWERTIPQSFDNVLYALLTFYEISTTEGWVTLMLAGVDATDVDMQPIANYHESWTLFFIAFIFLGSFFFIQLFIGVVIENFNRMKETLDGTRLLSCSQREWLLINQAVLKLRPKRKIRSPRGAFRLYCFRLARSSMLETVTMGAIMLNTFIMGLTYFGEEDLYSRIIEYANVFFTLLFALEAGIKIAGLGHYYWKDSWNIFDFVVVVGSCFGMIYTGVGGDAVGSSAAMIRGVRVLRLVRLIQTAPSLRQLVNTLLFTLPSLINIGGFLLLVFFIYAAVGVQLFAKVKLGDLVTPFANFQSISVAMITLIRCATGERWNDLMHELAETDNCVDDPDYDPDMCGFANFEGCTPLDGCGSPIAYLYFCSFTMLITYILLNIFIAVILEGFANEKDQANGVLLPQHYENFVATWSILDPEATGMIEWHLLPKLIQQLDEPLGYGCHDNEVSVKEVTAFIEFLDIAVYNGNRVFFNDVVRRLGKFVLDIVNEAPVPDLPSTIAVSQKWRMLMKGGKMRKPERYQVKHLHASVLLHDAVRSLIFREELHARVQKFTELTKDVLGSHHKRDAPASRRNSFGLHSYAEEEVAH